MNHRIDALVLDMDGVIYRGDEALPGAAACSRLYVGRGFGYTGDE